jgi:hypothetical protein
MNSHRQHVALVALLAFAAARLVAQDVTAQPPARPQEGNRPQPPTGQGQTQPGRGKSEGRPPVARQVIDHLRQNNAQKFQQLMQLRKTDQKAFNNELHQLVKAWQKRNQQRRPLSREEILCRELSERYHQTDNEEEKEALRRDLAAAVEQAFETRVKATENRIERMEKELQKFKERLELLKKNRHTVCEDRLQELIRPPELNWGGDW